MKLKLIHLLTICAVCSDALPSTTVSLLVGYMNFQNVNHNACQIDGINVANQIAVGKNLFTKNLCGQQVTVKVGETEVQGTVIDALDTGNRVMLSPNLFEQVSTLDTGIVQGVLVLPTLDSQTPETLDSDCFSSPQSNPVSDVDKKQMGILPDIQDQAPMDINDGYQHVLYQSNPNDSNDITFYFSSDGTGGKCGPANNIQSFPESNGYSACEPNSGYQTLRQRNNDNIVAIPVSLMDKTKYCGKRVIVTINGRERDDLDLVVWDSCFQCSEPGNGGLDFSSNMFAELVGVERCSEGRIKGEMSWRIVDEQIMEWHQ